MFKKYLVFIVFFISANSISAQIEKEISSFIDSTELAVNNGRRLLIQSVKDKDYEKTKQIYDYLLEVSSENGCYAFKFIEEIYINTLISDWEGWKRLTTNLNNENRNYCYPLNYQLLQALYNEIEINIDIVMYDSGSLIDEDRQILDVYFSFLRTGIVDEFYSQKVKAFKFQFPNSKYTYFLNTSLPKPKVKGAFTFYFGTSSIIITNKLSESFYPKLNYIMGMDLNVHRFYGSLYFTGGDFELQKEFNTTTNGEVLSFYKGDKFDYIEYGLFSGYFLLRNNRFQLSPYGSLSGNWLKSRIYDTNEDKEDDEYKVFNAFTCGVGFRTELKLFEWDIKNPGYYNIERNYLSIRFDIGYNWITSQSRDMFKGDMIYFRPTIVWGMGDY